MRNMLLAIVILGGAFPAGFACCWAAEAAPEGFKSLFDSLVQPVQME